MMKNHSRRRLELLALKFGHVTTAKTPVLVENDARNSIIMAKLVMHTWRVDLLTPVTLIWTKEYVLRILRSLCKDSLAPTVVAEKASGPLSPKHFAIKKRSRNLD